MNGDDFLRHAAAVVRDRRRAYGEPDAFFRDLATRWSQVLGIKVSPAQAALLLLDLKLCRLTRDPGHLDSLADLVGYSVCLQELRE
jgi:hypothetical protein